MTSVEVDVGSERADVGLLEAAGCADELDTPTAEGTDLVKGLLKDVKNARLGFPSANDVEDEPDDVIKGDDFGELSALSAKQLSKKGATAQPPQSGTNRRRSRSRDRYPVGDRILLNVSDDVSESSLTAAERALMSLIHASSIADTDAEDLSAMLDQGSRLTDVGPTALSTGLQSVSFTTQPADLIKLNVPLEPLQPNTAETEEREADVELKFQVQSETNVVERAETEENAAATLETGKPATKIANDLTVSGKGKEKNALQADSDKCEIDYQQSATRDIGSEMTESGKQNVESVTKETELNSDILDIDKTGSGEEASSQKARSDRPGEREPPLLTANVQFDEMAKRDGDTEERSDPMLSVLDVVSNVSTENDVVSCATDPEPLDDKESGDRVSNPSSSVEIEVADSDDSHESSKTPPISSSHEMSDPIQTEEQEVHTLEMGQSAVLGLTQSDSLPFSHGEGQATEINILSVDLDNGICMNTEEVIVEGHKVGVSSLTARLPDVEGIGTTPEEEGEFKDAIEPDEDEYVDSMEVLLDKEEFKDTQSRWQSLTGEDAYSDALCNNDSTD